MGRLQEFWYEELELAQKCKVYGEVKGYSLSGDAFHITKPSDDEAEDTELWKWPLKSLS